MKMATVLPALGVSLEGGVQAFWFDGRAIVVDPAGGEHRGSMQLRTTRLGRDGVPPGIPRMTRHGDDAILTWVEDGDPSRVMVGLVSID